LTDLGSDVPACYLGQLCFAEGRGEILTPLANPAPLAAVLVYPAQKNDTAAIFKKYNQKFSAPLSPPVAFESAYDLITFIENKHNDLTAAALQHTPVIASVLQSLSEAPACLLARMSGSGSACFGLFETPENAQKAAHDLAHKHREWWVQPCLLT
jgi:4-diphosphocytidyl-2-C-methyl-D-erythritol kinase